MMRIIITSLLITISVQLMAQLDRDQVQIILDQQDLSHLKIEDLDGDGDKDIIGSREGYNGTFVTYFNLDGQGNYGPPITFGDTTWWGNISVELNFDLGDMDNDGDLDLVPGRFAEGNIPYYMNDGNGTFSLPNINSTFYYDGVSDNDFFQVADLDNDGHQDVVVFHTVTRELFYNRRVEGGSVFAEILLHEAYLSLGGPYVEDFLLFDYDLDGDLDYALLVRNHVFGDTEIEQLYLYIYEQTCHLCFEEKLSIFLDEGPYIIIGKELAASDLDGDTYPDLLIRYQKSDFDYNERDHLLLYKNLEGSSTISLEEDIIDVSSVAVTDYNQDGNTDLFLAINSGQNPNFGGDEHYYWYENIGDFSYEPHLISEDYSGKTLFSEDLNQDGTPDLISLRERHPGILGIREGQADLSFS
ncbi:MAG: VCBS repeat-containing protein, partial [Bacteroidota bacterium]